MRRPVTGASGRPSRTMVASRCPAAARRRGLALRGCQDGLNRGCAPACRPARATLVAPAARLRVDKGCARPARRVESLARRAIFAIKQSRRPFVMRLERATPRGRSPCRAPLRVAAAATAAAAFLRCSWSLPRAAAPSSRVLGAAQQVRLAVPTAAPRQPGASEVRLREQRHGRPSAYLAG